MLLCRKNCLQVLFVELIGGTLFLAFFGHPILTRNQCQTEEVGNTAAFLVSPLASAITGAIIYVDNGLNAMGVGVDSPLFEGLDIPKDKH